MASIRDNYENIARRVLEVSGNSAYQPQGGEPQDDAGAMPTVTIEAHTDGTAVLPWRLDQDPLDDSHYFLL
jgi:hypothetical protein